MSSDQARPTFHGWWDSWLTREEKNLELIADRDPLAQWERNESPEVGSTSQLTLGVKVLLSGGAEGLATRFLKNAVVIAERALAESRAERMPDAFPLNRGILRRDRFLAEAILGNVDAQHAIDAAGDFKDYCAGVRRWDDLHEAYYVSALRLELLAKDSTVERDVTPRRTFRYHTEGLSIVRLVLDPGRRPEGKREVDVFFDKIRNPEYKPHVFSERDVECLEVSAMRYMKYLSFDESVDWWRAAQAVGE